MKLVGKQVLVSKAWPASVIEAHNLWPTPRLTPQERSILFLGRVTKYPFCDMMGATPAPVTSLQERRSDPPPPPLFTLQDYLGRDPLPQGRAVTRDPSPPEPRIKHVGISLQSNVRRDSGITGLLPSVFLGSVATQTTSKAAHVKKENETILTLFQQQL